MVTKEHIFVDTSAFKALLDPNDAFFADIWKLWPRLQNADNSVLVTSNFILDESLTLIRKRCGLEIAIELQNLIAQSVASIRVIRVLNEDEVHAWDWFMNDWSKLSFTDCVSFALMKRLGITRVVTFDEHFERAGFTVEKAN